MARKVQPREIETTPLVLEVSDSMMDLLSGLQITGMYGPTVETAAQRVLEQALFAMVMEAENGVRIPQPKKKAK